MGLEYIFETVQPTTMLSISPKNFKALDLFFLHFLIYKLLVLFLLIFKFLIWIIITGVSLNEHFCPKEHELETGMIS